MVPLFATVSSISKNPLVPKLPVKGTVVLAETAPASTPSLQPSPSESISNRLGMPSPSVSISMPPLNSAVSKTPSLSSSISIESMMPSPS